MSLSLHVYVLMTHVLYAYTDNFCANEWKRKNKKKKMNKESLVEKHFMEQFKYSGRNESYLKRRTLTLVLGCEGGKKGIFFLLFNEFDRILCCRHFLCLMNNTYTEFFFFSVDKRIFPQNIVIFNFTHAHPYTPPKIKDKKKQDKKK